MLNHHLFSCLWLSDAAVPLIVFNDGVASRAEYKQSFLFLTLSSLHNQTLHPNRSEVCTLRIMRSSHPEIEQSNMSALHEALPSGTCLCGHAGWEVLLPCKPLAAASQTGGKLSPRAVFEQGVMEKGWRWRWITPARRVFKIPHLNVVFEAVLQSLSSGVFDVGFHFIPVLHCDYQFSSQLFKNLLLCSVLFAVHFMFLAHFH